MYIHLLDRLYNRMENSSSTAQHYLEHDSCEENPAQYFCKMCTGYLWEQCKSEHEKKKK